MNTEKIDYQLSFKVETDLKEKTIEGFEQDLRIGRYVVQLSKDEGKAIFDSLPKRIKAEIKAHIERDYQKERKRVNFAWEKTSFQKTSIKKQAGAGYIYLIKSQGVYKIGRAKYPDERFKKYVTENPYEVNLLFSYEMDDYVNVETELLYKFKDKRIRGEWFDLSNSDIEEMERFLSTSVKS